MTDMKGRVAIVTGSSRGIGRGCAIELAKCGADVAVNYRTHREEAEEVAEMVRSCGSRAIVVPCDVGKRNEVQSLVDTTVKELGSVDIMVANSAYSVRKAFLELTEEDVATTWATCLWGVFHSCQLSARQMVKQGQGGKICIISSVQGTLPIQNCMAYATAKAGINHMARVIANDLVKYRINVNVLEPGWTDTPGERRYASDEDLQRGAKALPMGRLGTIEENGKAVVFLCSDDADYITGASLCVDGGFRFFPWKGNPTGD